MGWTLICIATFVPGVDVGWQKTEDGGFEYIIQIEPQLLEALKNGEEIGSEIEPELRHVRRYRIICGEKPLPKDPIPPPPKPDPPPQPKPIPSEELEEPPPESPKEGAPPQPADPSESPLLFWLAWGLAGGFFAAFVFLLTAHIETRRRFRRFIADYFDNLNDIPGGNLDDIPGDRPDDDLDWMFTQTDSPSEP